MHFHGIDVRLTLQRPLQTYTMFGFIVGFFLKKNWFLEIISKSWFLKN
jgi:hypothetical protein